MVAIHELREVRIIEDHTQIEHGNHVAFHRFPTQTNEYNFIFIGFRTDEYNLNIFIGTDELKKMTNE
jgi:hypothetical protein